jgi:hypothetical protein
MPTTKMAEAAAETDRRVLHASGNRTTLTSGAASPHRRFRSGSRDIPDNADLSHRCQG